MGWNSWDCFATTVSEAQVKAQADYMALHLAHCGWHYIVVDIQWYVPEATGFDYREGAEVTLDAHGRFLPAPNRFPSCGGGFAPLADYVHRLGLGFGVHLLRGIPRAAVAANLPILGSDRRASEIADPSDTCPWNPDMFGIDMAKPGAQAYYDSVFAAFAEWGVDYVKVDDISRPYHAHVAEIEGIRRALDRTGRPMVLSLSPGATALSAAEHVKRHANLWRISDDFWDNWDVLREQFARLASWNEHRGPGHWPDADMLPFGVLDLGRRSSRFTPDERRTVMTLWSVARSPLMHGGDMTKMDDDTLSLLVNREVLAVNQDSRDNRPLFDDEGLIAWVAAPPSGEDRYVAFFNARDQNPLNDDQMVWSGPLGGGAQAFQTHLVDIPVAEGATVNLVADDGHGGNGDQHAIVWGDPVLQGPRGELSVLDLPWEQATSRWGSVTLHRTPAARELLLGGRPIDRGLLVHTKSLIRFRVPPGYDRLVAECGLEGSVLPRPSAARCVVYSETRRLGSDAGQIPAGQSSRPIDGLPVSVSLSELGFGGAVRVRDLWTGQILGTFATVFTRIIPWHGAGLFRLSPVEQVSAGARTDTRNACPNATRGTDGAAAGDVPDVHR
jgi:alpha-galactosidase